MRFPLPARTWILIPLCALGFLGWLSRERAERVDYVTNTDREEAVIDATSATGYAGGKRWLIIPEHNNRSYQWIAETQQMLAQNDWRIRHVDYDNAPFGREVHAASLYRWWLGLMAGCDHSISGRPLGISVERAALFAGPALHLLFAIATTVFVARCFEAFPAILLSLGLVTIYPFAAGFLPGVPDDQGLAWIFGLWSVLPLLAGMRGPASPTPSAPAVPATPAHRRTVAFFFLGGVAGGLGMWISVTNQLPVIAGIMIGALAAAVATRNNRKDQPAAPSEATPWRTWALGGAVTCLTAYLVEYFPSHMELQLRAIHPLYGVAWIGAGEFLAQSESWIRQEKSAWNPRRSALLALAIAAMVGLVIALVQAGAQAWFTSAQSATRLSYLPNGVVAKSSAAWIARDGLNGPVAATTLPLLFALAALWLLVRGKTEFRQRAALALALGPVLIAVALACRWLWWWNVVDGMLLALVLAGTAGATTSMARWLWSGLAGLVLLPGAIQLLPPKAAGENIEFTRLEVEGLLERALAHWIADHAGPDGAVILTPPDRTASWCFHGGLRGIGSANWENRAGIEATVRIVTSTTAAEAQTLLNERGITHIILPSWDTDLDEFARWTLRNPEDGFIMALHHWSLPPWLRPLPYKLPAVAGFEDQTVAILEVTGENNRAASLSRLAEYFVETQQLDLAGSAGQSLQRFPTDLGALVALAQVEKARGNAADFAKTFDALLASLAGGFDRTLPWDRRVSLAVVLAQGNRSDLAQEQLRRCLEKVDAARVRSLTTGSLFRLQVLGKAYGLPIADPAVRDLARKLLPAELRERI